MGAKKMGYQGLLYRGSAGATAATQVTKARDIKYTVTPKTGSTTTRGDGSSVPIETGEVVSISIGLTWNMIHDASDTSLTAFRAAAATGAAIALRYIPVSGGTGCDVDAIISCDHGAPLGGEQTFDFAIVAITDGSRTPLLNS